jgi:DNA-binding CsgD family transcriptional regulator
MIQLSSRYRLDPPGLDAWTKAAMGVAIAVGGTAIGEALTTALKVIIHFDAIFLGSLHREAPPIVAYFTGTREPGIHYSEGSYLLDPFYTHFLKGEGGGCYRLSDLAPEGFRRSEYFSSFYRHLDIGDELGLLAPIDSQSCAHVSIIRRPGAALFTRRDRDWLCAANLLVSEAIKRVNVMDAPPAADASAVHDSLRRAYHNFGASVLTEREREVTQLLLRGNSAKSIARSLYIAADTARNHLKHIYSKLDVASQTELFALFFRVLERVDSDCDVDPLLRLKTLE